MLKLPVDIRKTFYINDFLIKEKIKVKDNGEKMIEIKQDDIKISPFRNDEPPKINDKEIQSMLHLESKLLLEYEKQNGFGIFVRESVYNKLRKVNSYFNKKGYQICIKVGYRPLSVQHKLFEEIKKYIHKKYPTKTDNEIYNITCEYVADPNNFVPPHCTGGAVDLVLLDLKGNQVDMGGPINYPGEISNITYTNLTKKQLKNRMFLCDTMLKFGFANLASEWWHFSYGDPIWAYFYGKKESLYGTISI